MDRVPHKIFLIVIPDDGVTMIGICLSNLNLKDYLCKNLRLLLKNIGNFKHRFWPCFDLVYSLWEAAGCHQGLGTFLANGHQGKMVLAESKNEIIQLSIDMFKQHDKSLCIHYSTQKSDNGSVIGLNWTRSAQSFKNLAIISCSLTSKDRICVYIISYLKTTLRTNT